MCVCVHTHANTHLHLDIIVSLQYTGIYMHVYTFVYFAESSHFMYANQSTFLLEGYSPEWSFPLQDCIINPYVGFS